RVGARSAPPRRWLPWRLSGALAAGLAGGVALGFALGFFARDFWPEQMAASRVPIARQAALAHAAYLPEVRHPVEVFAQDEAHLVAWLSKRLQVPIRAPSLLKAGYRLLGGRLLPPAGETGDAPVALLMYENEQGKRLSLLLRREPAHRETAFRFSQNGPISVFYWIDGPVGCAIAGELSREELNAIARLVYQQLNP
ncbi:MAG TPA: anti-sigma factor, partial [Burkholderiaceae bacterium]|nr:anti-sigma factor [Burkholderiaceae bacterium]